jgi:membrane protein
MFHSTLSIGHQVSSIWELGGLTVRELAQRVWDGINQNDLLNRGYELAFTFLFAVFPFLLFLTALFGAFASEQSKLRIELFLYLQPALPPAAYGLLTDTFNEITRNASSGKLTFGLLFSAYAALAGMTQMMSALNAAYEVRESRSWTKIHLISLALTIAMSILIISALLLVFAGGEVLELAGRSGHLGSVLAVAGVLQWTVALGFVMFVLALVYYFGPDVKEQHWYWITPGSVVGVLLWAIASAGLRVYLHFFNSFSKTYGSLGAVIILMLWFYLTGLAFLVGGQINATIEHAAAEYGHPEAKPAGKKAA